MGVTNVGKTTQRDLLVQYGKEQGINIAGVKYPVYDLAPTGPLIHQCLKEGNPNNWNAAKLQQMCAQNRHDFQPELKKLLSENDIVVVEMYTATGYCFGMGEGVPWQLLKEWNEGLLEPDISIFLDGNRFIESIEKGHRFEEDFLKTEVIRNFHYLLGEKYGWCLVMSHQGKMAVHENIKSIIFG